MKLECTWPNGVDWDGLNEPDRRRIAKIGLRAWLAENRKPTPIPPKKPKKRPK